MPGIDSAPQIRPADLLRAHYAGQSGGFITQASELAGGIAAFSILTPAPMWNHAAWVEGSAEEFESFLDAGRSWQSGRNRRPVIYAANPATDQLLALQKAGFEKFDEEAWMVFAGKSPPTSRRAAEVRDEAAASDLVTVFNSSFQIHQEGYERALRRQDARIRHFVLYDNDAAVCCGSLIAGAAGCSGIYNLGTPPSLRGRGYGRELFQHLAATARAAGHETIFLQAENGGAAQRIYGQCGFATVFIRCGFRLRDWQPRDAGRTRLSNALGSRAPGAGGNIYARETRPLALNPAVRGFSTVQLCAAAWAYLLHRYTGDETVAFTRRSDAGLPDEPVEIRVARDLPVARWLHENVAPLCVSAAAEAGESLLSFRPSAPGHLELHGFPIELHFTGDRPGSVEIVYRADLFAKDSIRRLGAHFATALESLAADSGASVGQLEILPAAERRQLFAEWNQPRFQLSDRRIHQLFEAQVESTPDAPAIVLARIGVTAPPAPWTYRQLNRRANRLAHRLQALGVGPETFVGVCLGRSPEMVVALLAILKAGGACVPLDPASPAERLAFILRDTAAPVVLTEKALARNLAEASAKLILLDEPQARETAGAERNLVSSVTPENAAYVIYTSGSTGQPKGVVVPHHAIANHALDCRTVYGLSSRDRVLQFSSFNFDASFEQILPALIAGAMLAVRDSEVWTTREFERKLAEFQLTVADLPTAYWHQLADEWHRAGAVPANRLRLVIVGGEALSPDKLALWQQTAMNGVRLINAYGPTETIITATSHEVPPRKSGDPAAPVLPIGRPRGDRKAYVLDSFGTPAPVGVPGELHLGGTLLARGYHRRPELTAARFISNPFSDEPDARLYKTGDLVRYLDDGCLEFLGRLDDQVKIRGFRVELGEVESCLRAHPAVGDAVVLARPGVSGENRLVAYAAPNGRPLSERDLRAFVRARLPEYMAPAAIMVLERLPLLPSGKVDRRALPEPGDQVTGGGEALGPRDPLELQIKLVFERVLKRVPIGIDLSFFELGGDSLQALELLVELEKTTGNQLPLGTLYQSSTVETLARELRQRASPGEWSSLVPLQISGQRTPLFLLHTTPGDILAYGNLVYRLGPDQPCYGFQSLGLNEPEFGHSSVPEMARYYVDRLLESHPRGPYCLGGWCYGGIVAVEMARILKEEGEEVALLALLETIALPPNLTNWRYFARRLGCVLRMTPRRWLTYFREKARYLRAARVANRMRFRQVDKDSATAGEFGKARADRLARLEHVYNTNLKALDSYRSRFYDGKVVLFNAAEQDPAIVPDPHYGWTGLAREIEIHDVPGNHDTMLTEPNVSVLARQLSTCLEQAGRHFSGRNA